MKLKTWIKQKKENEKPNEIVNIAEEISEFNKQKQEERTKNTNTRSNAWQITNYFS